MLVGARAGRCCLRYQSRAFGAACSYSSSSARSIRTNEPIAPTRAELRRRKQHDGALSTRGAHNDAIPAKEESQFVNEHSHLLAEANARQARIQYGDRLPEGLLSQEEYKIYERLFGPPVSVLSAEETLEFEEGATTVELETDASQRGDILAQEPRTELLREEYALRDEEEEEIDEDEELDDEEDLQRMLQRERAEEEYYQMDQAQEYSRPRTHPLTLEGRFNTSPAIFDLPQDSMVIPTTKELGQLSAKHLSEAADQIFGGRFLPDSVATPRIPHVQQAPPRLIATQSSMSPNEAGVFIAGNVPGMYACVSSALVETRKRLGSSWLERLLDRTGGPRILDVGSAGAGVQAWREVLRAEWQRLHPHPAPGKECPMGKSTVVVGSAELRERISFLSSDTSFLPRVPDFDRKRDLPGWSGFEPGARKHYDVIVASHTLWTLNEEYERRNLVQNLWSLLDPNGGVLVLIEKGIPRGFELIGGARELLLNHHIKSPGPIIEEELIVQNEAGENRHTQKETGMIIAPCTSHGQCPMYTVPGEMQGRKDWCHFSTRFTRPPYLKRLLGGRVFDHERIRFSFLSVQRGKDLREMLGISQDETATQAAFAGFEDAVSRTPAASEEASTGEEPIEEPSSTPYSNSSPTAAAPSMLSLPRLILPALKRRGHVTFDVCTPSGTIERWTTTKTRSRQAYRDARKLQWGDLWALGAKTRVLRSPRTGVPKEKDKARLSRRKQARDDREAAAFDVFAEEKDREGDWVDVQGAPLSKGRSRKRGPRRKKKREGKGEE